MDVVSGKRIVSDAARGDRIGAEHVLVSRAPMPSFAPVEMGGGLLADGGFAANTPVDVALGDDEDCDRLCFVVGLFARQGGRRPHTLAASASRAGDLTFGNQTRGIVEGRQRERRLRSMIAMLAG